MKEFGVGEGSVLNIVWEGVFLDDVVFIKYIIGIIIVILEVRSFWYEIFLKFRVIISYIYYKFYFNFINILVVI